MHFFFFFIRCPKTKIYNKYLCNFLYHILRAFVIFLSSKSVTGLQKDRRGLRTHRQKDPTERIWRRSTVERDAGQIQDIFKRKTRICVSSRRHVHWNRRKNLLSSVGNERRAWKRRWGFFQKINCRLTISIVCENTFFSEMEYLINISR